MKIKITIDGSSDAGELVATADFITTIAIHRGAHVAVGPTPVLCAPLDEAELAEPEDVVVVITPPAQAGTEPPKRRRRTRAEMVAAEAAAAPAPDTDPHQTLVEIETEKATAIPEDGVGNDQPAPTPPAPETAGVEKEVAADTPATASPSDKVTYTPAEVQKIAVDTARRFGPEKVKALIAEYPTAVKIADIPAADLAGFVAKLHAIT